MSFEQRTNPARRVRVILADDHELARAGLRAMLTSDPELELIGEATNGREAVNLCRQVQPDLALLDIRMPEVDGLSAAREIQDGSQRTKILIITMQDNADYLRRAVQAGVSGYILKDATRFELLAAIRQVLRGKSCLDGAMAARALQGMTSPQDGQAATSERLTPRELDVLRLLAKGLTNRAIAGHLVVSVGTIKVHVEHIIAKLGVTDRTQAAVRALELGLLQSDPR